LDYRLWNRAKPDLVTCSKVLVFHVIEDIVFVCL
jgi:hypothetical protein